MKHSTKLLVMFAAVIGAVGLAATGWAFWTASGSGSASASIGTLTPPTNVHASSTPGSGIVHVTWDAPLTPSVEPSGYYVQRLGGTTSPAPACSTSSTVPTTASSCNDDSVANGTYTYTVTALFSTSWTALSDPSNLVTVSNGGPLDHFSVSAPTTATAGITFSTVSVSALSAGGQPATGWTSTTRCVTFSGPANSPNGSSPDYPSLGGCTAGQSSLTFDSSGQATSLAFILKKAETTSLTVTSLTGGKTGQSGSIAVSDGGIDHLVVGAPGNATAGTAITGITLTAQDLYNNTAKTYAAGNHTITWSGPLNSPAPANTAPVLPASTVSFTDGGSTTALSATLYNTGSNLLVATDAGSKTGSTTITVNPAGAATLTASSGTSQTAGTPFNVTVTAKDSFGNRASGYTGTVGFGLNVADPTATGLGNYTFTTSGGSPDNGQHVFPVTLTKAVTAAGQSITATDTVTSSISGFQGGITVASGSATSVTVSSGSGQSATVNAGFTNPLVALAKDSFNNPVPGVTVTFTAPGSGASGKFANTTATTATTTDTNGLAPASAFTANTTAGAYNVSAAAGSGSVNFALTNSPGSVTSVTVSSGSGQSATVNAGFTNPLVALAKDSFNNPVPGVTVTFTAPGSGASGKFANTTATTATTTDTNGLAPASAFTANTTAGAYNVSAAAGSGSVNFALTNTAGSASTLTVSSGTAQTAGTPFNVTVTAKDSFGNRVSGYTGTVGFGLNVADPTATGLGNYTFTTSGGSPDNGQHVFPVTLTKAVTAAGQSITATDTVPISITGSQTGITVNPAGATTLTVSGFTSPTIAGAAHNVTVTARDSFSNTATGYTGTVALTSSDGQAVLPANYHFVAGDNGTHDLSVTLKTAGARSIIATDTVTGTITGSQTGITVNAATASALCFVTSASGTACVSTQIVGGGGTFTGKVQLVDAFGNPVSAGAAIPVGISKVGTLDPPSTTSVTIALGSSQSESVSDTLSNSGSNKSGTLTGHATSISNDATVLIKSN